MGNKRVISTFNSEDTAQDLVATVYGALPRLTIVGDDHSPKSKSREDSQYNLNTNNQPAQKTTLQWHVLSNLKTSPHTHNSEVITKLSLNLSIVIIISHTLKHLHEFKEGKSYNTCNKISLFPSFSLYIHIYVLHNTHTRTYIYVTNL